MSNPYGHSMPPMGNGNSPSVPLSVYRELAAELQATQAMLDSLHAQNQRLSEDNQQLSEQNQKLQSEISNVVRSALRLREVANSDNDPRAREFDTELPPSFDFGLKSPPPQHPPTPSTSRSPSAFPFPQPEPSDRAFDKPPLSATQQQPANPDWLMGSSEETSDRQGFWLGVAIFFIVVAAFGAGYWLVRPMISNTNR